ncbi:hypothetical protein CTAYLR_000973 [Chrysophaeum taylorii]|uniref:SSD domain-containing protein n=1 Tax=Chrysophaeum taylorii TaxID=2483200 RepID=A0AAD7UHG0_9STRA|nr:hypothetical protein CTAYLR_000973 [Chrysophaeum taylorii]
MQDVVMLAEEDAEMVEPKEELVAAPPTPPSALTRAAKLLELLIGRTCGRLAVVVSRWPYRTILISVVVCLVMSTGWLNLDDEDQVEKLYTPQNTRAFSDRDWVEDRFGDAPSMSQAYLNRKGKRTNLLTKDALLEVFDLHELVLSISSEGGSRGYDSRSCERVYWNAEAVLCQKQSVLAFWDYNRTLLEEDDNITATINRGGDKEDCCSPTSRTVSLDSVAGKFRYTNGVITGAGALRVVYYLETHLNRKSRSDPHAMRLERKFQDRIRDPEWTYFEKPFPITNWGNSENSQRNFDYDRAFINASIVIIILYAFFALYTRDKDRSRGQLGLGAVLCVVLSTAAAFGIAMASGLTFSPSTGVAIFLVLGIGLDDSFVICSAVDDHLADHDRARSPLENDARDVMEKGKTVEEVTARRIVHTLASSGPSITVTSLTDTAAFVAGSFTETPDVSNFNRFCAISVLVDFAMQLTFFVALFTLDQRRRLRVKIEQLKKEEEEEEEEAERQRRLARCCFREKRVRDEEEPAVPPAAAAAAAAAKDDETPPQVVAVPTTNKDDDDDEDDDDDHREVPRGARMHADPAHHFWGVTYANALLSPLGKALVLASMVTILTLAGIGVSQLDMDIEDAWTVVGGVEEKALNFQKKHFGSATDWVGVYTKRTDYFANRDAFYDVLAKYDDLNFVAGDSASTSWYAAYDAWLSDSGITNLNQNDWESNLRLYLNTTDGLAYADKIVFDDRGAVVATEIDTYWKSDGNEGGDGTRRMRKAREEVRGTDVGTVIVYNNGFIWNESFAIILRTTVFAMSIACIVVFVILVLLLGDVLAALIVSCFVGFVCVSTLGAVYWYNDAVNYITSFFIVIAVGLSADAPAHIMHAFLESRRPTRQGRACHALETLGPSVFKGGFSTILGIAITGACVTYVFRTFFNYLMTILILALYSGLCLMPVICSLVGPMPTHDIHLSHDNLRRAGNLIEEAARQGVQFAALPECFVGKYGVSNFAGHAEKLGEEGSGSAMLAQAAARTGITVAGGIIENAEHDKLYNSIVSYGPRGHVATYRKRHLSRVLGITSESDVLTAGDEHVVAAVETLEIGMACCFDLRFRDFLSGYDFVDILCAPSAFLEVTGRDHWELLARRAALDGQCYVVAPNVAYDDADEVPLHGCSIVADPWGRVLAKTAPDQDALAIADVDRAFISETRSKLPLETCRNSVVLCQSSN